VPSYAVYRPILRHNPLAWEPLSRGPALDVPANEPPIEQRVSGTIGHDGVSDLRRHRYAALLGTLGRPLSACPATHDKIVAPDALRGILAGSGALGEHHDARVAQPSGRVETATISRRDRARLPTTGRTSSSTKTLPLPALSDRKSSGLSSPRRHGISLPTHKPTGVHRLAAGRFRESPTEIPVPVATQPCRRATKTSSRPGAPRRA